MANNNAAQGYAWIGVLAFLTFCLFRLGWSIAPLFGACLLTLYFIVVFLNSIGAKPKRVDSKQRTARGDSNGAGDRARGADAG